MTHELVIADKPLVAKMLLVPPEMWAHIFSFLRSDELYPLVWVCKKEIAQYRALCYQGVHPPDSVVLFRTILDVLINMRQMRKETRWQFSFERFLFHRAIRRGHRYNQVAMLLVKYWGCRFEKFCNIYDDVLIMETVGDGLEIAHFLMKIGFPQKKHICRLGARRGDLELVKSSWDQNDADMGVVAAGEGHLHIVKWAYENGVVDTTNIAYIAANKNHINILDWLISIDATLPADICTKAASMGHFEVVKKIYDFRMATVCSCQNKIATCSCDDCLMKFFSDEIDLIQMAAMNNHREIVEWACERRFRWDQQTTRNSHPDLIKLLLEKGCPYDTQIVYNIAREGRIDILAWLWEFDQELSFEMLLLGAIDTTRIDVLQWAHAEGIPICNDAVMWVGASQEIIQWGHDNRYIDKDEVADEARRQIDEWDDWRW